MRYKPTKLKPKWRSSIAFELWSTSFELTVPTDRLSAYGWPWPSTIKRIYMWATRNQIEVKCCCLVCWKLGLKGQNYSTQSNLIQSGLKGHSYHFLHPSHLFNINMYDMYCKHYYKRVQNSYLSQISQIICGEILGDFATIYALSCGEKLSPKSTFVEKKWQIWGLCSSHGAPAKLAVTGIPYNQPQPYLCQNLFVVVSQRLSRIKRFQVQSPGKFCPTALNFGWDFWAPAAFC